MVEWVTQHWDGLFIAFTSIVTAASMVARLTPTEVDDKWIQKLLDFVNLLALNKKPQ